MNSVTSYVQNEYEMLIKNNFDDVVSNVHYNANDITSDVNNHHIKNMICKCINGDHKYQLVKTGLYSNCVTCGGTFPKSKIPIPISSNYKNILNYLNINVTVNNYNNFSSSSEIDSDIEYKISNDIFDNIYLTNTINQCLDGHKISDVCKLLKYIYPNFVHDNNEWFYFDVIWKKDIEEIYLKKRILDLREILAKVSNYYRQKNNKESNDIIKNINILKTKICKPSFKDEIVKEAKLYFSDFGFTNKLNSHKHLLAFTNGDYISITCGYAYNESANEHEIREFLDDSIKNSPEREYVLKKLSLSLNGNLYDNLHYVILSGDFSKNVLLNLMNSTLGSYSRKLDPSIVLRKRTDIDKIKFLDSRFLYITELDDKKLNIENITEFMLEDIVIKNAYRESFLRNIEGKIFLAYDKLPEMNDLENTKLILLNNQRMNDHHYKNSLMTMINENCLYKQTFMNILLQYYVKDIQEVERHLNIINSFYQVNESSYITWFDKHIILSIDNILNLKDIAEYYYSNSRVHSKQASILRKEFETYLNFKYPNMTSNFRDTTFKGKKVRGWVGLGYKS